MAAKTTKNAPATKKAAAKKTPAKASPKGAKPSAPAPKPAPKAPAPKAVQATPKAPAPKAPPAEQAYDVKSGPKQGRISGYHIDTDRPVAHGVARRSAGTIGGRLWAIFDKMAEKVESVAELKISEVKASKLVEGFNANKVAIEFYLWRKFQGVRGRGSKQKIG